MRTYQNLTIKSSSRFFIVANLPYNIATTLIINWLKIITKFESIIVMVQRRWHKEYLPKYQPNTM